MFYIQIHPIYQNPIQNKLLASPITFAGKWQDLEKAIHKDRPRYCYTLPEGWQECFDLDPKGIYLLDKFRALAPCHRIPAIVYCELYLASNPRCKPTHQEVINELLRRYPVINKLKPGSITAALTNVNQSMGLTDTVRGQAIQRGMEQWRIFENQYLNPPVGFMTGKPEYERQAAWRKLPNSVRMIGHHYLTLKASSQNTPSLAEIRSNIHTQHPDLTLPKSVIRIALYGLTKAMDLTDLKRRQAVRQGKEQWRIFENEYQDPPAGFMADKQADERQAAWRKLPDRVRVIGFFDLSSEHKQSAELILKTLQTEHSDLVITPGRRFSNILSLVRAKLKEAENVSAK